VSRFRFAEKTAQISLVLAACACGSSASHDDASGGGAGLSGAGGAAGSPNGAGTAGAPAGTGGAEAGGAGTGGTGAGGDGQPGGKAGTGGSASAGKGGGGGSEVVAGAAGSSAGSPTGGGAGAGSAGSSGSGGDSQPAGDPKEQALAPLRDERQEHSVVALAGEIYVVGGYVSGSISDSVDAYDPESDSWREVESFPGPLQHSNAGVVDGKLYVAGWYMTAGTTSTAEQCFEYDPAADAWTEKSPMPAGTGRATGCVAVHDGRFYVFGGAIDGTSVTDSSRYDPVLDEWEVLPDLPEPREHCAAGAIGETIYVAGGRVDEIVNIEADVWAFDPAEKSWTPKAPLLKPRAGFAAAVLGGKLYTFGGEGNPESNIGIFADIDVYDPEGDAWEALPPMLVPRHGFGAAVLGERIYLAGGAIRQGGTPSAENSVFYLE
jgi:N-acetylneuraminic acid mutarotase